jgi:hypothetical protein
LRVSGGGGYGEQALADTTSVSANMAEDRTVKCDTFAPGRASPAQETDWTTFTWHLRRLERSRVTVRVRSWFGRCQAGT